MKSQLNKKQNHQLNLLANYLSELRFSYQISQSEMAAETNISRSSIIRYENKGVGSISLKRLLDIADYYDMPLSELLSILD